MAVPPSANKSKKKNRQNGILVTIKKVSVFVLVSGAQGSNARQGQQTETIHNGQFLLSLRRNKSANYVH
jgi:hypothetical protein